MTATTYTRRRALRLGAGFAVAAALVACSSNRSSDRGDRGTPTPVAVSKLIRPRTLVAGARPGAATMQLGRVRPAGAPADWDADDILFVYSRLVAVDPREPGVSAGLAHGVEQPDPLTVRFLLRDGLRFHPDADDQVRPLTAEAIRADFVRRAAEGHPLFKDVIDRVEVPDNHSVSLRLRARFGLVFDLLAAADASIRSERPYKGSDIPAGSGVFMPVQHDSLKSRYVANNLGGGAIAPLLAGIDITAAPTAADLDAMFSRGEVDVRAYSAGLATPPPIPTDARLARRPARRLRGLGLSLLPSKNGVTVRAVEAFQDQRVRKAVALSLDRNALRALDDAYTAGPVGPAHAGDALPVAELDGHELYRRDPASARALLSAAGHDGLSFHLAFPDQSLMLSMAQIVADNLAAAGFSPQLQNLPTTDWQKVFLAGDFETVLFDLGGLDTPDLGLRLHTTGGLTGRFSTWGYSNPLYDAATRKALAALDPGERAYLSREAQRLLLDDVPAMFPVSASPEYALIADGVSAYEFEAYDYNTGFLAANWAIGRR